MIVIMYMTSQSKMAAKNPRNLVFLTFQHQTAVISCMSSRSPCFFFFFTSYVTILPLSDFDFWQLRQILVEFQNKETFFFIIVRFLTIVGRLEALLKSSIFIPFSVNLTHYGPKSTIIEMHCSSCNLCAPWS